MKTTLKRVAAPKTWPILRKTTKFITRPRPKGHAMQFTLPVVVVLRDMLQLVQTAKQAKQAMREHEIRVNGKRVYQTDSSVSFMDVLSVGKEHYVITLTERGVLTAQKAKDDTSVQKLAGKTHLSGGKLQLNFLSGMNLIVGKDTYKVHDSLAIKGGKVAHHYAFAKGADVLVTGGSHVGTMGKIDSIEGDTCTIKAGSTSFQTTKEHVYIVKS